MLLFVLNAPLDDVGELRIFFNAAGVEGMRDCLVDVAAVGLHLGK